MTPKIKTGFLRCKIEKRNGDEAYISTEQSDGTTVCGLTLLSELTPDLNDPRFSLLEVEILKETAEKALVTWPVQCPCIEMCPGDEFWVLKKLLT